MSSGSKKPKTPESEKVQSQMAKAFFDSGTRIKAKVGDKFLGDLKRDARGRIAAKSNAETAINQRDRLKAARGRNKFTAAVADPEQGYAELATSAQGGIADSKRVVSSSASAAAAGKNTLRSISYVSDLKNQKALGKFTDRMQRIDSAMAAGAAAASYGVDKYNENKANQQKQREDSFNSAIVNEILYGP